MKILLFLFTLFLIGCSSNEPQVCIEDNCFDVEIPVTQEEFRQGLMFREFLDEDKGMLFRFDESDTHAFWMKNTLIPLDIMWINEDFEIVHIQRLTPPCKEERCPAYAPKEKAKYVFEINGGLAKKLDISEGDTVVFNLEE